MSFIMHMVKHSLQWAPFRRLSIFTQTDPRQYNAKYSGLYSTISVG
jgi:hypothetical protein